MAAAVALCAATMSTGACSDSEPTAADQVDSSTANDGSTTMSAAQPPVAGALNSSEAAIAAFCPNLAGALEAMFPGTFEGGVPTNSELAATTPTAYRFDEGERECGINASFFTQGPVRDLFLMVDSSDTSELVDCEPVSGSADPLTFVAYCPSVPGAVTVNNMLFFEVGGTQMVMLVAAPHGDDRVVPFATASIGLSYLVDHAG